MNFRTLLINSFIFVASLLVATTALDRILLYTISQGWITPNLAHAPNSHERRKNLEFDVEFTTNDLGFRSPPMAIDKAADRFRLMVVGDSFVEGFGVEASDSFTTRLDNELRDSSRTDLLNAGISGQGPKKYEELIVTYGRKLQIDGALLVLFANDLWDMDTLENRSIYLRMATTAWPTLSSLGKNARRSFLFQGDASPPKEGNFLKKVRRQARAQNIPEETITAWEEQLQPAWLEAADKGLISAPVLSFGLLHPEFWSDSIDIKSDNAQRKWGLMQDSLKDIENYLAKIDVELGVVYIPSVFQYDPASHENDNPWALLGTQLSDHWLDGETEIVTRLKNHFADADVPFLDLTPGLRESVSQQGSVFNFQMDEHLTPRGHEEVARQISEWLSQESVFSFVD